MKDLTNISNIWNLLKGNLRIMIPDLSEAKLITVILDFENKTLKATENGSTFYDIEVNKNQFHSIKFLLAGKLEKGKKAEKVYVTFDYEVERNPGITIKHTDGTTQTINI